MDGPYSQTRISGNGHKGCAWAYSSAPFDEMMPKTLATATVDRLLHHAHICQTTGESVRLTEVLAAQGVSPLS